MIKLDKRNLESLKKIIKENTMTARVGILADSPKIHKGSALTNVEIGVIHEFGTEDMPRRSFLRMPLEMKLNPTLKEKNRLETAMIAKILETKDLTPLFKRILRISQRIIQDAFDTGGFGQWKPSDFSRKKVHQTLVETSQLRRSIRGEVVK